jgi:hypothetical protein
MTARTLLGTALVGCLLSTAAQSQPATLATAHCLAAAPSDSARDDVREAIRLTLLTAARAAGIDQPRGLVLVMMNRDGTDAVFRMIEGNLPDGALQVAAPHLAGLAAAWPGEERVRLIVRLDPLPLPDCLPGHDRRLVEPRLVRPDVGRQVACQMVRRHGVRRVGITELMLWVVLSREGRVAYSELHASDGSLVPEHELRDEIAALQLRPATVDGVPQDILFATSLMVRVRPEVRPTQRLGRRFASGPAPMWHLLRDPSGCPA